MHLSLRQATDSDSKFSESINKQNMAPYFLRYGIEWNPDRFARDWSELENHVICADNKDVGVLRLSSDSESLQIRDVHVLSSMMGQGIGSWAIAQAIALARARGLSTVELRVFKDNPASRLYARLGFSVRDEAAETLHMQYSVS